MNARSASLRIHDMLESINGIEKAIAGKTIRDFERSWLLRSAVERGIEVISEASRHLGSEMKAYQRVDTSIIWKAVKDDLPPLKLALLALQKSLR